MKQEKKKSCFVICLSSFLRTPKIRLQIASIL